MTRLEETAFATAAAAMTDGNLSIMEAQAKKMLAELKAEDARRNDPRMIFATDLVILCLRERTERTELKRLHRETRHRV